MLQKTNLFSSTAITRYFDWLVADRTKLPSRSLRGSLLLASACLLSACGGGGEKLCGSENQTFTIDFEESFYSVNAGEEVDVAAKVFPEACLTEMTFTTRSGSFPEGLTFDGGRIKGVASVTGEFPVQVMISGVAGYQQTSFASFNAPRSREITVVVR